MPQNNVLVAEGVTPQGTTNPPTDASGPPAATADKTSDQAKAPYRRHVCPDCC